LTQPSFPAPSPVTLGTVQLGMAYGNVVRNRPPDRRTTLEMLDLAAASGVTCLDTAAAYGNAEARIGQWLGRRSASGPRIAVVTKLAALDDAEDPDLAGVVGQRIRGSQDRLGLARIDGYLVHRASDLLRQGVVEALHTAVDEDAIAAFGVSVYDAAELECAIGVDALSLVQLPFSVLDRRMARSGALAACAERGVTVFARSVFLQGLVFLDPAALPPHFDRLRSRLSALRDLAARSNVSIAAICLHSVMIEPGIASTVIGAATPEQLAQTLVAADEKVPPKILDEARGLGEGLDADILDPRRWP